MSQYDEIFASDSNRFDTRKGTNRAYNITIPPAFLTALQEEGLTSEMIKAFDLPIFRYQTQITLHGNFGQQELDRIGGYKNTIVNQNGTLGIRYNAIDYQKKKTIGHYLRPLGWHYQRDSTGDQYVLNVGTTRQKAQAVVDRIDIGPYYASKYILVDPRYGTFYVGVSLRALDESDVWPFILNLAGVPREQVEQALADAEEKRRIDNGEYMRKAAIEKQKDAENRVIGMKELTDRYVPEIEQYPVWDGQFVANTVLVGLSLSYSSKPRFEIYQLRKRGGHLQYCGGPATSLTSTPAPYDNFNPDKQTSPSPKQLERSLSSKSLVPFRVLSSPVVPLAKKAVASARSTGSTRPTEQYTKTASSGVLETLTGGQYPGSATLRENKRMNGIEVMFAQFPGDQVLTALKALGYKFAKSGLWYVRYSPELFSKTSALLTLRVNHTASAVHQTALPDKNPQVIAKLKLQRLRLRLTYYANADNNG